MNTEPFSVHQISSARFSDRGSYPVRYVPSETSGGRLVARLGHGARGPLARAARRPRYSGLRGYQAKLGFWRFLNCLLFPDHVPAPDRPAAAERNQASSGSCRRSAVNSRSGILAGSAPGLSSWSTGRNRTAPYGDSPEPPVQLQQLLIGQQTLPARRDFRGQCCQAALAELTLPVVDRRLRDLQDIRNFCPCISLLQQADRVNPFVAAGAPSFPCHRRTTGSPLDQGC
jgi:hypothetical protein